MAILPENAGAIAFEPICVIGLMSGTSADGVDAALVHTDGQSAFEFVHALTVPYPHDLRQGLIRLAQASGCLDSLFRIEAQLTEAHVAACQLLLRETNEEPCLIGFHGHTVRHDPAAGVTWQIGNPNLLAEQLGCPVVSDFRGRDVAAGGEGAPLAPLFHRELLRAVPKPTAVLNLGGVGNLTWLGESDAILAGDTGPGCGLIDGWMMQATGAAHGQGWYSGRAGPNS